MSAPEWFLAAVIAFAVGGTAVLLGIARWQFNRDKARWAARFARPLTIVHLGEDDSERDDYGVSGDTIARVRCWQRALDTARDGEHR